MSLIDAFYTPCVMAHAASQPDGEGGRTQTWEAGADGCSDRFLAAIVKDSSYAARVAEKETGKASYTVTTQRSLAFHDVFMRESDGVCFRITGSTADSSPPGCSSFYFNQATAEVWEDD